MSWLSGVGCGLALLQGWLILLAFPRLLAARCYALLMLAVTAFLGHPLLDAGQVLTQPVRTAIPALFWWLCVLAFTDRPHRFRWGAAAALYTVVPPAVLGLVTLGAAPGVWADRLMRDGPQLVEYGLILHGLVVVALHWRDDLVQSRRRLRVWLLGIAGGVIFAQVVMEQWLTEALAIKLLIANLALVVTASLLLTGRAGVLLGPPVRLPPLGRPPEASGLVALEGALAEGLYRREGLTLNGFARAIGLPEYRTRQLINRHLGFRNFPDFVNHYRLRDASERLVSEPGTPVTVVALDLGFRSVSSFNRVFKEEFGMSPSQYRRQTAGPE